MNFANLKEPLSKEELEVLLQSRDNPDNREKIIIHNLRLVLWIAKKYYMEGKNELDDIFQLGVMGLMKAIDKYNPERGSFSTVAVLYIRASITRNMFLFTDDDPIDEIIPGTEDVMVKDSVPSNDPLPDEVALNSVFIKELEDEIKPKLTEIEYRSFMLYYGLGSREYSLVEIARLYDKTPMEIRTAKNKAIEIIKRSKLIQGIEKEVNKQTIFYKSIDYTQPRVKGGQISSPVERIVTEREKLRNYLNGKYLDNVL